MPIEITRVPDTESRAPGDALVSLQVIGTLDRKDYEKVVPQLEHMIRQQGKISLLIELVDFTGWTPAAAWEDLKFDFKHYKDVQRLAVVGERNWEEKMTKLTKALTQGDVRYFDASDRDKARAWLQEAPAGKS